MMNQRTFRRAFAGLLTAFAVWGGLPVPRCQSSPPLPRIRRCAFWAGCPGSPATHWWCRPSDSPGVRVDLRRVDQAEYQSLAAGDLVIVTGIIPYEGDRVVATSIKPLSP